MTGSMSALVWAGGRQVTVERRPRPTAGDGQVLVDVAYCGLCGTDLKMVQGGFEGRWPSSLPCIIGHEWSGQVVEIGAPDEGFAFDCERPRHRVFLSAHQIANRRVTNKEWRELRKTK